MVKQQVEGAWIPRSPGSHTTPTALNNILTYRNMRNKGLSFYLLVSVVLWLIAKPNPNRYIKPNEEEI
jgi:hypothetical protein